jgi:simple sugar transport system permease protein
VNTVVLATLLVIAIQLMAPVLWASLGEIVAERSGVLNIGTEGCLLLGAWASALVLSHGQSLFLAVVAGIGVGVLTGGVLAVLYVWRRVDQIIGGIMVNLLALGLTTALWTLLRGDETSGNAPSLPIPLLSDIPVVGEALFDQNIFVYASILAAVALFFVLRQTRWGLRLRAAGEAPAALDAAGVSVRRLRVSGLLVGSALAALGGTTLVLTSGAGSFVFDMSAGRGFIALGVVLLARWNPLLALLITAVFGLLQALQFQAQSIGWLSGVPTDVWIAAPYVVAIIAVAVAHGTRYPKAVGVAWTGR